MKRTSIIAVALVACLSLGLASIASGAKNGDGNKLVKTKLSIAYNPGGNGPYNQNARFTGRAKTKQVCRGDRKVKIPEVGKTTTDQDGNYEIDAGSGVAPGKYQATIKKKVVEQNNGKKVICKKAKSPKVKVS